MLDGVGADVFRAVKDGMKLRLDGDTLYAGTGEDAAVLAEGRPQTIETVAASLLEATAGLSTQLEAFAADTM